MARSILQFFAWLGFCEHQWEESRRHAGKQKCVHCRIYRDTPRRNVSKPRRIVVGRK